MKDIIIEDLTFRFTYKGKEYLVKVSAVDSSETDQYSVTVNEDIFYVDSCGGLTDDSEMVFNDEVLMKVYSFLFDRSIQSIMKGF